MAKKKENSILMTKEGFFFGSQLKNGNLNKDARRISEDEILTMFMHMFSAYCQKNNTDTLVIKKDDYMMVVREIVTENGGTDTPNQT